MDFELIPCSCCGNDMPKLRLTKYGYSHCVKCSTVQPVACIQVITHKTGNTIEIVDQETAKKANYLIQRPGYGVSKGMKHGHS